MPRMISGVQSALDIGMDVSFEVSKNGMHTADSVWIGSRVLHDPLGLYNTSNGRFTPPVAGRYFFNFTWLSTSSAYETSVLIRRYIGSASDYEAGSLYKRIRSQGHASHISMSGHRMCELVIGDYVDIYGESGIIYGDTNNWTSFSGFLIR